MSAHALHHTQHCICYFFVTESTTAKAVKAVKTSKASGSKGDPVDTIRCYLYAMRQAGMAQVDEADVLTAAGYKRTDSTGYRRAMKELIKESGHVIRVGKGVLSLTEAGVAFQQEHGPVVEFAAPTMENHQATLLQTLLGHVKTKETVVRDLWNLLLDGKEHTTEELLKVGGYKRTDSTGFREFMKRVKKMELLEKGTGKNSWIFTDKVYRHGCRP